MKKRSASLFTLGILFTFLGGISLLSALFPLERHDHFVDMYVQASRNTLITVQDSYDKTMNEKEHYDKLRASGNVEKYRKEYHSFVKAFKNNSEKYLTFHQNTLHLYAAALFTISLTVFIAGIGLLLLKDWARKISIVAFFFGFLYYISALIGLYSPLEAMQLIINTGHKMNMMIDPSYSALADTASDNPHFTVKKMIYGFPFIIIHLSVIASVVWSVWYFYKPSIKEQFSK